MRLSQEDEDTNDDNEDEDGEHREGPRASSTNQTTKAEPNLTKNSAAKANKVKDKPAQVLKQSTASNIMTMKLIRVLKKQPVPAKIHQNYNPMEKTK